jgi:hypothetical protein
MDTPAPPPGELGFLDWLRQHSGLRIDREARFLYRGEPVGHPRVLALFKQGLGRAQDGRVTLTVGRMWCFVDADGPLFLARRALCEAEGERLERCLLKLDDEREEWLVGPLALDQEGVLHARVKEGREWARCLPEAQAALGRFVEEGPVGMVLCTTRGPWPIGGPEALGWS